MLNKQQKLLANKEFILEDTTLELTRKSLEEPRGTGAGRFLAIPQIEPTPIQRSTIKATQFKPYQTLKTPIITGIGKRLEEGAKMEVDFFPVEQQMRTAFQVGGSITQHPEKQGFERGVTSAGFPTQEQMTGLGFRQGAASYKPQKYALGEEVIRQEEVPPQQEERPPQQVVEAPPQSVEGQQIGNIEAAKEQGLSMQPQEIREPDAQPEEKAADDVEMTVPEGSYVLNHKAVDLAGEDYIAKIIKDAEKIAAKKGINVTRVKPISEDDKEDIRISNGEVIIPPELVTIIGEHTLKLINDKGIAAMKKEEQLQQDPQAGQYGGAETPPPPQAYGGLIDMKKGYASGGKTPFDPEGSGYDYESAKKYGIKPTIDITGKEKWQSRVPQTGLLLKGKKHETWWKTERDEKAAGYLIIKKGNRYYGVKTILSSPRRFKQETESAIAQKNSE